MTFHFRQVGIAIAAALTLGSAATAQEIAASASVDGLSEAELRFAAITVKNGTGYECKVIDKADDDQFGVIELYCDGRIFRARKNGSEAWSMCSSDCY